MNASPKGKAKRIPMLVPTCKIGIKGTRPRVVIKAVITGPIKSLKKALARPARSILQDEKLQVSITHLSHKIHKATNQNHAKSIKETLQEENQEGERCQ